MKTKEFIEKVEALGFRVHVRGKEIKVCDESCGYGVGEPMFVLVSDFVEVLVPGKVYISSLERISLLSFIVEYLDTPPSEREEEKRYWLRKLPVPLLDKTKGDMWYYKHKQPWGSSGVDKYKTDDGDYQTIFTESEIAKMDITGFEKVEVTE